MRWRRWPATWGWLGDGDAGGGGSWPGRWWRTLIAWMAWPRLAWTRRTFFGPPARRPPGGSPVLWTWSAVGCWMWWPTTPGPRWTAGSAPDRTAAGPGWHGRPGSLTRLCQRADGPARPCHRGRGPLPRRPAGQHGG